nr:hypothetical protein [Tanacetum cinerariifolium]
MSYCRRKDHGHHYRLSILYLQSLIHKHRLMFEICTMNQKRAHMFLETVHICSNEFDEKAQLAHMFFGRVLVCSNEFDKKVKRVRMMIIDEEISQADVNMCQFRHLKEKGTFCHILAKYKSNLARPFDEATVSP